MRRPITWLWLWVTMQACFPRLQSLSLIHIFKITQIFNREDVKKEEFTERSNALGRAKREQIFVFGIFRPLVYMLYISSVLCLLYLGGKGYIENTKFLGQTLTSGTIVTFYMYISKFFDPIQNLAEQFNWLQSAFASAEKEMCIRDSI